MGSLKISRKRLEKWRRTGRTMLHGCPQTLTDQETERQLAQKEQELKEKENGMRYAEWRKLHPGLDKDIQQKLEEEK